MDFTRLLTLYPDAGLPLDDPRAVRMVRHRDARWDLERFLRLGYLEEYQARQGREVFGGASHILSFMGERGVRARFLGAWRILGCRQGRFTGPPGYPEDDLSRPSRPGFRYDLERLAGLEDLEDRVVIDWGLGTRSWVQRLRPKTVIEVLPRGHARDFPGYLEILLPFDELERIVLNPDANQVWHTMLRSVAGVYLITDTATGHQYVGSASGKGGLLQRWSGYVRTGHGNNKQLRDLLEQDPDAHLAFQFSILRTLPITMTPREVHAIESLFKRKLGSRAFGLNSN